jgi:uncharacterized protein YndB with AHSA1/START domain
MTFAPGGVWRFVMHGPDGRDYENKIMFGEIARPERISYLHPGDDGAEPVRREVTISFAEKNGKTRLTWRCVFRPSRNAIGSTANLVQRKASDRL